MTYLDKSSLFYLDVISLIDSKDYSGAVTMITSNVHSLDNPDDLALAYLNCGFLIDKIGDNNKAIDFFSKSISLEAEIENIIYRSKDVSLSGRSNSRYKNGDYFGAIEDKRSAKKLRLLENDTFSDSSHIKIDFKNILLGTFHNINLEPKYITLIKVSQIKKSKYDLIADYKNVISMNRKLEVINKLELMSESKYLIGDYKGSINAIRRSEKYY